MYATLVLTVSLMGLTTFVRVVEAFRRHVVCVRFEHELRQAVDGAMQ